MRKKSQGSVLFTNSPVLAGNHAAPSRIKINKKNLSIEILDLPLQEEVSVPVDILKVIEFYARA